MKKLLLIPSLFLAAFAANGQITLEHTYADETVFAFVRLSQTNYKWALVDNNEIELYNEDHSIYKTIPMPSGVMNPLDVLYISNTLFDTDSTTIEFMVDNNFGTGVKIYREDGSVLFADSTLSAHYNNNIITNPMRPNWNPIVITADDSKMILCTVDGAGNPNGFKVYNLPGTYFQNALHTNVSNIANRMQLSNPFPNPSRNSAKISYTIPEGESEIAIVLYRLDGTEAKRFQVDRTFNTLELNNSELAAGTYLYQLVSQNQHSESKKMIVIK